MPRICQGRRQVFSALGDARVPWCLPGGKVPWCLPWCLPGCPPGVTEKLLFLVITRVSARGFAWCSPGKTHGKHQGKSIRDEKTRGGLRIWQTRYLVLPRVIPWVNAGCLQLPWESPGVSPGFAFLEISEIPDSRPTGNLAGHCCPGEHQGKHQGKSRVSGTLVLPWVTPGYPGRSQGVCNA